MQLSPRTHMLPARSRLLLTLLDFNIRLAKAAAEGGEVVHDAQTPLAQLAERCRVGVDADVARTRQRTTATGSLPAGDEWASVWAEPLGAVLQVRHLEASAARFLPFVSRQMQDNKAGALH